MSWWSDKIAAELTRLTGYGTAGRALTSNGGTNPPTWQAAGGSVSQADIIAAGGVVVLSQSVTPVSRTDDASVLDMLAYTLPSGTLTAGHALRIRMGGTYINNSGAGRVPTWSITLGGTTLWAASSPSLTNVATARTWWLEIEIAAESATLVHVIGFIAISHTNAPTTGLGVLTQLPAYAVPIGTAVGGVTVSSLSTGDRAIAVNHTHPTATSTQTMTRNRYGVELL